MRFFTSEVAGVVGDTVTESPPEHIALHTSEAGNSRNKESSEKLQFFSIAFTHLANHGSTSSNAHIFFAQQESSLANGLTISHCFHTNFFEF